METGDLFSHYASLQEIEEREEINIDEGFACWKEQPGARQVLRRFYARAAHWSKRWKRTGIPISLALIREEIRQEIKEGRIRAGRRGLDLKKWGGYRINNSFTPLIARHILSHREDWKGMFETRSRKGEKS